MAEVGGRAVDRDATQLMSVASTDREPNRWAVLALLGVAQLMVLDATIVTIAILRHRRPPHFSTEVGSGSSPPMRWRSAASCHWAESR